MSNKGIEYSSLDEQKKLQEKLLKIQLEYTEKYSPFYKKLLKENNINIKKIKRIGDLSQIPFTTKEDFQKYNFDFFCQSKSKIIDYLTTSGTTGKPVLIGLTEKDLKRLEYNEFLSLSCANLKKTDIVQLMTTMDRRFMAGLAYYYGVRRLKAGIIRVGAGTPEFQWDTINLIKPNTIITAPLFIIKLIDYALEHNIDYKNSSINKAICIGDTIRQEDFHLNSLGKRIEELWDIKLYSTYASTEMATAFTECENNCGGHHHPQLIITEFLDENYDPVSEGTPGELVITNLGVEGLPLIRYRTGDICSFHAEPCKCGRTTIRLGPVLGRKKQMIKFKGTTLYPNSLYDILDCFEFIENYQIVVHKGEFGLDYITIKLSFKYSNENYLNIIKDKLKSKLRVTPHLEVLSKEELTGLVYPESCRKSNKFIDLRIKY